MDDVTMNKYIKCINYLISKKTQEVPSYDKNLFQHLINVYNKLRKWGCEEDLCYAGLFHSVYGNETWTHKVETDRSIIKNLIGPEAESIVYQYNEDRNQNKKTRIISLANKLDSTMILTFDNYLDKHDIDTNYFYFRDFVSWQFIGAGKDLYKWRKFNYKLKFKNKIEKNLQKQTESILKDMHVFDLLELERTYASANPYGTVHESHVDYHEDFNLNLKGGITVMYYLNNFWNFNYAGETVFYNKDNQDILKSIIPKPGRIIVFDGTIEHCAREVRRDLNDLRMVLTFKYKINLD
tara:strand:- start:416 stop:1300 length:885 start_codon:yes stop_codon:yes gene_type:complete